MRNVLIALLVISALIAAPAIELSARGRGSAGSRGMSRGMSRPSMPRSAPRPNYSRPASRPSAPTMSRPSAPANRRPSPSQRPSTANRGNLTPGTRPATRPGNITPGTRPATRPGDLTPGTGTRPSLPNSGNRPNVSRPSQLPSRPGTSNRPGISALPGVAALPGLANRPGVGERPGLGERPSVADRQDHLQDRLNQRDDRVGDRTENRDDRFDNRQENIDNRRDTFNDWHDQHYDHHGDWMHGHWDDCWEPGDRWNYWWDNYPALTAFGLTTWAINRTGWAFGYYDYSNPYAEPVDSGYYDYSEPLVMTPDEQSLAEDPNAPPEPPSVSPEALAAFDRARQEFFQGKYEDALASTDAALKVIPNDAVIHEFRALVAFALGKYQDSAAGLYAVLSVGPGWDWTTMIGLYPEVAAYTDQLRALETARDAKPDDPSLRFVLAYHYQTAGHNDAAEGQLKKLLAIAPDDKLAAQLLQQLDPQAEIPQAAPQVKPPKPESEITDAQITADWTAMRGANTFDMSLKSDKTFSWKYTESGKTSEVTGVWGIDKEGILALEMNDQGVMTAQVTLKDGQLDFYMLGDTQGAEPLHFKKK